jgi:CheY-like chemotaxis protein
VRQTKNGPFPEGTSQAREPHTEDTQCNRFSLLSQREELDLIISEARRAADMADSLLASVRQEPSECGPEQGGPAQPRPRHKLVTAEHKPDCDSIPSVLLVDDEPAIRRSVGRYLRISGYDVDVASTGREAANALRARPYDAIVSDLRMPELSGEELFELLKDEFPDLTSRIVFTSGDLRREETNSFIQQAGCPALSKPYDLPDLLAVVAQLCNSDEGRGHS